MGGEVGEGSDGESRARMRREVVMVDSECITWAWRRREGEVFAFKLRTRTEDDGKVGGFVTRCG